MVQPELAANAGVAERGGATAIIGVAGRLPGELAEADQSSPSGRRSRSPAASGATRQAVRQRILGKAGSDAAGVTIDAAPARQAAESKERLIGLIPFSGPCVPKGGISTK